jgi:hypothetical protein
MALNRVNVWVEDVKGVKFTCAECMQESPVNNRTEEKAWWPPDISQLLIVADFFPEYDYVNKTQQAH